MSLDFNCKKRSYCVLIEVESKPKVTIFQSLSNFKSSIIGDPNPRFWGNYLQQSFIEWTRYARSKQGVAYHSFWRRWSSWWRLAGGDDSHENSAMDIPCMLDRVNVGTVDRPVQPVDLRLPRCGEYCHPAAPFGARSDTSDPIQVALYVVKRGHAQCLVMKAVVNGLSSEFVACCQPCCHL